MFRKELLTVPEKTLLRKYAVGINRKITSFSIEFRKPKSYKEKYEKEQVINAFGGLPKQEIGFFGLADPIFMAAEEVLRVFGGFVPMGIGGESREEIQAVKGITIEIFEKRNYIPPVEDALYFLLNFEAVANYNTKIDPYVRSACDFSKYEALM